MNSKDTVLAVMKDVQGLREHDRKTGQDARWQGLDKVPDAALHSLKMHGGRLTHDVLSSNFLNSINDQGVKINRGTAVVRFKVFGSDESEPVSEDVHSMDEAKGNNAYAKLYKRALRTFFVDLLQLPDDRSEGGYPSFEDAYADVRKLSKSHPKHFSEIVDIPWSPRTEALGAQVAFLTAEEYAVEWARYLIDSLMLSEGTRVRRRYVARVQKWLPEALQEVGFSKAQAEYGASQHHF
jgi:hypothetical protein